MAASRQSANAPQHCYDVQARAGLPGYQGAGLSSEQRSIEYADIEFEGATVQVEIQWVGVARSEWPVVVFLHEGLGSISMWRDFPHRFSTAHGFTGLVFSRVGYGRSTPRPPGSSLGIDYLHRQAHDALPALLARLGIERPWLFGHSDGGSIALLYAARYPHMLSGVIAMAPHIFVEDITIEGIRAARRAYATTDLRARLARHHRDADSVFYGWNDVWLDPAFRQWNIESDLPHIVCPTLAIQGEDDEYGTLDQIHGIQRHVLHAQVLALAQCGHSPHRDQPDLVSDAAAHLIKHAPPQIVADA